MKCEEVQLKAQAIIDNELDEEEIDAVMAHIETCYTCRCEYVNLLKLQRRLGKTSIPEPPKEWYEDLAKKRFRTVGMIIGRIAFFGSYLFLFAYFLYEYFINPSENPLIKLGVAGIVIGGLFLFGISLYDRNRELKSDRYKEVEK